MPWLDVEELLVRRRGLLDGVVFTGGEALRQAAIVPAMERVRELGLSVGLHTAGAYPHRLAEVLELVDWVGLDIKAEPGDYREAAGFAAGMKAWDSLKLVLAEARARGGVGRTADYVGTVDVAGPAAVGLAGVGIGAIDNAGATAARPFTSAKSASPYFREPRPSATSRFFSHACVRWVWSTLLSRKHALRARMRSSRRWRSAGTRCAGARGLRRNGGGGSRGRIYHCRGSLGR